MYRSIDFGEKNNQQQNDFDFDTANTVNSGQTVVAVQKVKDGAVKMATNLGHSLRKLVKKSDKNPESPLPPCSLEPESISGHVEVTSNTSLSNSSQAGGPINSQDEMLQLGIALSLSEAEAKTTEKVLETRTAENELFRSRKYWCVNGHQADVLDADEDIGIGQCSQCHMAKDGSVILHSCSKCDWEICTKCVMNNQDKWNILFDRLVTFFKKYDSKKPKEQIIENAEYGVKYGEQNLNAVLFDRYGASLNTEDMLNQAPNSLASPDAPPNPFDSHIIEGNPFA